MSREGPRFWETLRSRFALALTLVASVLPVHAQSDSSEPTDIIGPARIALAHVQQELRDRGWNNTEQSNHEQGVRRHADLLLKAGQPAAALKLLEALEDPTLDSRLTIVNVLLAQHEYSQVGPVIKELGKQHPDEARARGLVYQWWTLRGDLGRLDRALHERAAAGTTVLVDRFAAADLKLRQLDYAGAREAFLELEKSTVDAAERARAISGVGDTLFHLQRYDEALGRLHEALALAPSDAGTVSGIGDVLLRLGRVDEAVDTLRFALRISPWNERAHQLLGSGFTRRNYTQLLAAFPGTFAGTTGLQALERADQVLSRRHVEAARKSYAEVAALHPGWADAEVRLGSLEYAERNFAGARDHYWKAVGLCPEYGRAHEGLARSLEAIRLQIDIHHQQDEADLRATAMPVIPQIEQYVINWHSLSARHQKRLVLSLQPWARYIPALRLGGATLYVKPTYQLLSQAPYEEHLHDQRIDYDSRLWDDVRGEGGHHVVVSTEDVETRISSTGYDTVLHEVSHQVHAILSLEWTRRIQTLYAQTKRRQATSGNEFLSQYAASSVWEYFAEGANSLNNRRRDAYDTREIVFERLQWRDPELLSLTREIMEDADVGPSYAAALVSRGDDFLSRGKPHDADAMYIKALHRDPNNERALAARMHALTILGDYAQARKLAATGSLTHPDSGAIAAERAEVEWLAGTPDADIIHSLEAARPATNTDERYLVDLRLGTLAYYIGDGSAAQRAFTDVLAYQPDNPEALTGMAGVASSQGRLVEAWKYYDAAVRVRSGDLDVRVLYARDLLLARDLARAKQQIDTALLLDPDDPDALAVHAWQLLAAGDTNTALQVAQRAHKLAPWSTLATIIAATAERRAGCGTVAEEILRPLEGRLRNGSPPQYVFRGKSGRYSLAYTLPVVDRELMKTLAAADPSG